MTSPEARAALRAFNKILHLQSAEGGFGKAVRRGITADLKEHLEQGILRSSVYQLIQGRHKQSEKGIVLIYMPPSMCGIHGKMKFVPEKLLPGHLARNA